MRSNCYFWAWAEYLRRAREWRASGSIWGDEPKMASRPSRHRPRKIWHWSVQQYRGGKLVEEVSFVPIHPVDGPIWIAWTRLWYIGMVVEGDEP